VHQCIVDTGPPTCTVIGAQCAENSTTRHSADAGNTQSTLTWLRMRGLHLLPCSSPTWLSQ
jgi:hypothetical protein